MKLLNQNIFELKGTDGRFLHLATAQEGLREYICMFDIQSNQCYVERFVDGQLEAIIDNNEFDDVANWFIARELLDVRRVLMFINLKKSDSSG